VQYDKRGYPKEVRAFDANGDLAERYQGAAIWKATFDDFGNELEIASYGKDERLIENPRYDAAIFRRTFDERGNVLSLQAFDTADKPTTLSLGYSMARFTYNDRQPTHLRILFWS